MQIVKININLFGQTGVNVINSLIQNHIYQTSFLVYLYLASLANNKILLTFNGYLINISLNFSKQIVYFIIITLTSVSQN